MSSVTSSLVYTFTAQALAVIIGLTPSQELGAAVFGAESFTLANGMQVVAISNHRVPVVSHMVWYKVGSADENLGKSGIAHFLEHLMFKGTPSYPEGSMTDIVARNGGQQNAFTSYDYTGYYQNIAVDRLPLMMQIEADRMTNLILSEEDVALEREVVLEERRQRVDNRPAALLGERLSAALWVTNHYGVPVIGWEEEIRSLSRKDAFDFYRRWYAPNNTILVVAGDITLEELRPLAETYYGAIPHNPKVQPRKRSEVLPPAANVRVTMSDPRVLQPSWSRIYIAPSHNVGPRTDVYALQILAEHLGGGSTSRLYQAMVVDRQVAAGFSTSYAADAVSWGWFSLRIEPGPGVTTVDAEGALEEELANFLDAGVTQEDVERSRRRMLARLAYVKDSPNAVATTIGSSLAMGLTLEDVEYWPERLAEITAEQVTDVARRLFKQAPHGTGILLPEIRN